MKDKIKFNEFLDIQNKLEIIYGTIISVEKMEKSDKMLKLIVDFGEESHRIVMTNIGNKIGEPDFIVGWQFPFITNLAPVKIMGVESEAMIMIVEGNDGTILWSNFPNGAKLL